MEGHNPSEALEALPATHGLAMLRQHFGSDLLRGALPNLLPPLPDSEQMDHLAQARWLNSARDWKQRFGNDWVAHKVLGRGGQGIVGHFRYTGNDPGEKEIGDIVIKQSALKDGRDRGLTEEHYFLKMFVS